MGTSNVRRLFGRSMITTDADVVTSENVADVLKAALSTHEQNKSDIDYLYRYYKGEQPIYDRTKAFRADICNIVCVNLANEIVSFEAGFFLGKPIQYSCLSADEKQIEDIERFSDYMRMIGQDGTNLSVAEWCAICGLGYQFIMPSESADAISPFETFVADPRQTFIVKRNDISHTPVMGVYCTQNADGDKIYDVYTPTEIFKIKNDDLIERNPNPLNAIPIVEFLNNTHMIGSFEKVITLLDAINTTYSNRIDGIEQFIQSILIMKGMEVDEIRELMAAALNYGGLATPETADVFFLTQELNQQQTEVAIQSMHDMVLTICGIPNRNGGLSTSDTGLAVELRDGWSDANSRAVLKEGLFRASMSRIVGMAVNIMNTQLKTALEAANIKIEFTRHISVDIYQSVQSFAMLRQTGVHPLVAYEVANFVPDPTKAYKMELEYQAQLLKDKAEALSVPLDNDETTAGSEAPAV